MPFPGGKDAALYARHGCLTLRGHGIQIRRIPFLVAFCLWQKDVTINDHRTARYRYDVQ